MKKTTRIAALLAAAALIFGGLFFSCSDGDDGDNTGAGQDSGNTGSTTAGGGSSGGSSGGGNETITIDAAWDFTGNARSGKAVDGVSATQGGEIPSEAFELKTNKTGSGATMLIGTVIKCEWNGKLQFSTGTKDSDLFVINADAACTATISVGSASSSKSSGKVNALKLGETVIYNFDSVDTKDVAEKTIQLAKGENNFTGSGVVITKVVLSSN
ncbi:MAG: hypothetical protein NC041_06200 [Bacteroides sp.]|nr:hypothetical protein [Prevotella sp.]MCM1406887.1 hypothetical protein [Treponema brennaborense]MCM1470038.1 hypothetical protein [Bacteroides sp.]